MIITKAHACAGSPALELAVLAQHAAWWDEALLGIPTDRLDEVYRYAIAHHTSPFPLGTGAMVAAWDAIRTAPTFRMIPPQTPAEREQAEAERKANVAAFEARMRELA